MKAPKKPKFKALPKAPKMSASKEAWRNYEQKLKAVSAENAKKKAEYDRELKAYESEMKSRASIKEKAAKAKAKF